MSTDLESSELRPTVGVIGGTGLYDLLDDARWVDVDTPYGPPSDAIAIGTLAGVATAFLPRHGRGHEHPPHRINYRANIWALRALGVRRVVAPCAVGSLSASLAPGTLVVPDQVVDATRGRTATFFDSGGVHVSFADPYCPELRDAVLKAGADTGTELVDAGTMVIVEGPRFSSRAESQDFAARGWSLINMTGQPEAALARELALCYSPVALVTDVDAGVDATEAVSQHDVYAVFAERLGVLRAVVGSAVARIGGEPTCGCQRTLDGLPVPFALL